MMALANPPMKTLVFDFEWRTTILTVVLLPLLVALGFWQLDRANEKAALAAQNAARDAAEPLALADISDLTPEALAYLRVRISGRFLDRPLIFIDNQIRDGRYGHDVVSVFIDEASGQAVLLNRGWVPGDPARRSLPSVETPDVDLELRAQIYVPPGDPYLLQAEVFPELGAQVLVQESNSRALREAIEAATGSVLFPRELRLEPDQAAGFRRDWPVVNVSPSKHRGYAVQWFTMAAVLLLFFVFRSSNLAGVMGLGKQSEAS